MGIVIVKEKQKKMGREIRKVPKGWEHPKRDNGQYQPIFDEYYGDVLEEWNRNNALWNEGKHRDQLNRKPDEDPLPKFFAEWDGDAPKVEYYQKEKYTEAQKCCYQLYETVSEGTPRSPVFESLQALEDWLVNVQGYQRNNAHAFCQSGWAPSFVMNLGIGEMKKNIESCE